MSRAVNFVWNYCNDAQKHAVSWNKKWLSGFDLNYLTASSAKELKLNAQTIQAIGQQYAKSRMQHKKPWLKYRGKKQLGWVPLKGQSIRVDGDDFIFAGNVFRVFNSRPIPENANIKDGTNFSRDNRGRWYLNVVVEAPDCPVKTGTESVGIDLGLKDFAVLSTGEKIEAPRIFRKYQACLGKLQRANKKRSTKKIHDKIKNSRKDFHHKLSTSLVNKYNTIFVGNVNSSKLVKTKMAKSVLDAGWSSFKTMLTYKSIRNGVNYLEVDEKFSTQTCFVCGSLTGPKGLTGLNKRIWKCVECNSTHDRDVNSAKNILGCGRATLVEGIVLV